MFTAARGPRIEVTGFGNIRILRFSTAKFNREQILERAREARLDFNKALLVMAERLNIICIDDLKKYSISKVMLMEWEKDVEVISYISANGRALTSDFPMTDGQHERAESFRNKHVSLHAET